MRRFLGAAGAVALGLGVSTMLHAAPAAAANGRVFHLAQVGTEDRPMVVAATDRGIVFIGADTPLVPIYFGFGLNNEQENSFYLNMGRIFSPRN